jgi:hypothetical protein
MLENKVLQLLNNFKTINKIKILLTKQNKLIIIYKYKIILIVFDHLYNKSHYINRCKNIKIIKIMELLYVLIEEVLMIRNLKILLELLIIV